MGWWEGVSWDEWRGWKSGKEEKVGKDERGAGAGLLDYVVTTVHDYDYVFLSGVNLGSVCKSTGDVTTTIGQRQQNS